MKTCTKCLQTKPLADFYKRSDAEGYRYKCKPCSNRKISEVKLQAGAKRKLTDAQRQAHKKESLKKYHASHKEKQAYYEAMRRSMKRNAQPKWLTPEHKAHIAAYYETARILSDTYSTSFHVDHIIPLKGASVSGLHVPWNLQVMIAEANMLKGNRICD